jgi:broad specificity phosphatase PhoE
LANRLIIVRHAHRDVSDRADDNGLSPKGWRQAHEFAVWFKSTYSGIAPFIATSPKLRCQETVDPLKDLCIARIEPGLDEQHPQESHEQFVERIQRTLAQLRLAGVAKPPVVVCSHGDWIPVATEIGWAKTINLGKGQWIELDWNN